MSVIVKDMMKFFLEVFEKKSTLITEADIKRRRSERNHDLRMRVLTMSATLASVREGKYQSLPAASMISRFGSK